MAIGPDTNHTRANRAVACPATPRSEDPTLPALSPIQVTPSSVAAMVLDYRSHFEIAREEAREQLSRPTVETAKCNCLEVARIPDALFGDVARALNEQFRMNKGLHTPRNVVIPSYELKWFERLPAREQSSQRMVKIILGVPDLRGEFAHEKRSNLAEKGLIPTDPRDLVLLHALHQCAYNGDDLFSYRQILSSEGDISVGFDIKTGLHIARLDEYLYRDTLLVAGTLP